MLSNMNCGLIWIFGLGGKVPCPVPVTHLSPFPLIAVPPYPIRQARSLNYRSWVPCVEEASSPESVGEPRFGEFRGKAARCPMVPTQVTMFWLQTQPPSHIEAKRRAVPVLLTMGNPPERAQPWMGNTRKAIPRGIMCCPVFSAPRFF